MSTAPKLIDDRAQTPVRWLLPPSCSVAIISRRWCTRWSLHKFQANARSGKRAQKGRSDVKSPPRNRGVQRNGRARAGMVFPCGGGGKIFPNCLDENFAQASTRRCIAPVSPRSFLRSWCAKTA